MRRVTIRGLAARKLRLVLTALAIVLGVTFVTGTLVLGDTLNRTFDNLVGTVYQHVSFEIRGWPTLGKVKATGIDSTANRKPVPQSIAAVRAQTAGRGLLPTGRCPATPSSSPVAATRSARAAGPPDSPSIPTASSPHYGWCPVTHRRPAPRP